MPGETIVEVAQQAAVGCAESVIKVGDELLDYVSELGKIQELLQNAYTYAVQCRTNIQEEDTYKGEAYEEMEAFFMSLEAHIQKMIFLYQAVATYVSKVYTEMYYNDERLAQWAMNEIKGV